jgi:hypothetical protein
VCRADNLTAFMCQLSSKLEASTSWNPQDLYMPVQGFTCTSSQAKKATMLRSLAPPVLMGPLGKKISHNPLIFIQNLTFHEMFICNPSLSLTAIFRGNLIRLQLIKAQQQVSLQWDIYFIDLIYDILQLFYCLGSYQNVLHCTSLSYFLHPT